MQITIDTEKDSIEDLNALRDLLTAMIARRNGQTAPTGYDNQPVAAPEMFAIFQNDNQPIVQTHAQTAQASTPPHPPKKTTPSFNDQIIMYD